MRLKNRIKEIFSKDSESPLIETKQRIFLPDDFLDNLKNVCAVRLTKDNVSSGVRLYSYKANGNSLQKELVRDMSEQEWQAFEISLNEAKERGYIEGDRVDIPTSLCDGKRGVYALAVKKYSDGAFKKIGVNIYRTDENLRNYYIRSMSQKKWGTFMEYIEAARKEEENIRRNNFLQFDTFDEHKPLS